MERSESWRRSREAAHQLYRAAMLPDPLNSWARLISDLLDIEMADVSVLAPSGRTLELGTTELGGAHGQEFLDYYQYINPLRRFWASAPEGKVFNLGSLVDDDLRRTEFYSRYGEYFNITDNICMLLSSGGSKILVHARPATRPRGGQMARELLASLRDDLSLSFEIASAFLGASNMVKSIIHGLDQNDVGAAVLSEDGRVEASNHSMDALLHTGHVFRLEQGRLTPGASIVLPEFAELVRRTRKSGVGGRVFYSDTSGARRGSIVAYPAPAAFDWGAANEKKVVLLVTDNSQRKAALGEMLRKIYGLTTAQTRVAELLRDGNTSRQIAAELEVQANSIRAHLKAIYAKTGTHSQVELLNLLQRNSEYSVLTG